MKAAIKLITSFIVILTLSSCATTDNKIPEKYDLDRQFMRVNRITDFPLDRTKSLPTYLEMVIKSRENKNDEKAQSQPVYGPIYCPDCQISKVDEQSLIIRGGPDKNYLLILQRPVPNILHNVEIRIMTSSLNTNEINAKTDAILIGEGVRCPIERIYMLGDDEQAVTVKNQLLGKPKTYFPPRKRKLI